MTEAAFDWDDLTIEEIETIEDVSGLPIDMIQEQGSPRGKALRAMVYVIKRRENPDFTLEDAGKVSVKTVNELTTGTPAPPTQAAG